MVDSTDCSTPELTDDQRERIRVIIQETRVKPNNPCSRIDSETLQESIGRISESLLTADEQKEKIRGIIQRFRTKPDNSEARKDFIDKIHNCLLIIAEEKGKIKSLKLSRTEPDNPEARQHSIRKICESAAIIAEQQTEIRDIIKHYKVKPQNSRSRINPEALQDFIDKISDGVVLSKFHVVWSGYCDSISMQKDKKKDKISLQRDSLLDRELEKFDKSIDDAIYHLENINRQKYETAQRMGFPVSSLGKFMEEAEQSQEYGYLYQLRKQAKCRLKTAIKVSTSDIYSGLIDKIADHYYRFFLKLPGKSSSGPFAEIVGVALEAIGCPIEYHYPLIEKALESHWTRSLRRSKTKTPRHPLRRR